MARTYTTTLLLSLLALFISQEMHVTAQFGTVQNSPLINFLNYMNSNSGPQQPPSPPPTPAPQPQAPPPAVPATPAAMAQTQAPAPANTNAPPPSTPGLQDAFVPLASTAFMDLFSSPFVPTPPPSYNPAPPAPAPTQPVPPPPTNQAVQQPPQNNAADFYAQLLQVVNQPPPPPQPAPYKPQPQTYPPQPQAYQPPQPQTYQTQPPQPYQPPQPQTYQPQQPQTYPPQPQAYQPPQPQTYQTQPPQPYQPPQPQAYQPPQPQAYQPYQPPAPPAPQQPATTPAPVQVAVNDVGRSTHRIIPFVPKSWNHLPQGAAPAQSHGTTGWGHNTAHRGPTAWEQYYNPNHRPAPKPQPMVSHSMNMMMKMPQFRKMITQQATRYGDLAYYQQHGCMDPTPTKPPPGGIRSTQTLWLGCQSPVSRMVCMRAGKAAGVVANPMMRMMAMMNPQMTRTMEKCFSPKTLQSLMFGGMSGGMGGGMNPMMMMMMNGGGGGGGAGAGMAGMAPMLMMMNQQNQMRARQNQMNGGFNPRGMDGGLTGGMNAGGLNPSGMMSGMSGGLLDATGGKARDPSSANTLISQAARIPNGAATPVTARQTPNNPLAALFGFGSSGGAQTATASALPVGAASSSNTFSPSGGTGAPAALPPVDCRTVMPMIMSRAMAAGEGLTSPEAMEALGQMRKEYLPFGCQEFSLKYSGMPLRLCCPGKVEKPTMMDLMNAKRATAA